MPAESKSQRRGAAVALRVKRGSMKLAQVEPPKFRAVVKSMLSMSESQLEDFAKGSEEGLPKKKKVRDKRRG